MLTAKKKVLEAIQDLPEEVDLADVIERIYLLLKIQRGLNQADKEPPRWPRAPTR